MYLSGILDINSIKLFLYLNTCLYTPILQIHINKVTKSNNNINNKFICMNLERLYENSANFYEINKLYEGTIFYVRSIKIGC